MSLFRYFPLLAFCCVLFGCEAVEHQANHDQRVSNEALRKIQLAKASQGVGAPILFLVEDDDTKMYIFGIIEMLPDNVQWQSPQIEAALKSSKYFIKENFVYTVAEWDRFMNLIDRESRLTDEGDIYDNLPPADFSNLTKVLQENELKAEEQFQYKPLRIQSNLATAILERSGYSIYNNPMDTLGVMASDDGILLSALELPEIWVPEFFARSTSLQMESLRYVLEYKDDIIPMNDQLVEEWLDGDLAGMTELCLGQSVLCQYNNAATFAFMRGVNESWVENLDFLLQTYPEQFFVGVGMGHLVGESNVIEGLERRGYRVSIVS